MINQCMHVEDLSTREHLYRIVRQLAPDATLHDDLMQEALVHLWLREARFPGQKKSWYLQSCKFHLQHYLELGKSVDSAKRRGGQIPLPEEEEGETSVHEPRSTDTSFFSQISARELLSLLSKSLTPREKAILDCLADGLGAREIARKLQITHPTALRSRRKIAKLVIQLGLGSFPGSRTPAMRQNGIAKLKQRKTVTRSNGSKPDLVSLTQPQGIDAVA